MCVCVLSVNVCPCLMAQPLISTGLPLFCRFADQFLHSHHSFSWLLRPCTYRISLLISDNRTTSWHLLTVYVNVSVWRVSVQEREVRVCMCARKLVCPTSSFTVVVFIYCDGVGFFFLSPSFVWILCKLGSVCAEVSVCVFLVSMISLPVTLHRMCLLTTISLLLYYQPNTLSLFVSL